MGLLKNGELQITINSVAKNLSDSLQFSRVALAQHIRAQENKKENTEVLMKSLFVLTLFFATTLSAHAYQIITPGPSVTVGNGTVRSFITTDTYAKPIEIGFWLSTMALQGLPAHDSLFEIPLPTGADVEPYNHLTLDWNPHGHIPPGIYDVPHFDFHFYMISSQEREQITCDVNDSKCMKTPTPDSLPANYVPTPEGVPKMGWHWVDGTSPEFHGQPFTATFVYGYYDAEVIFVEPMVALSYLTNTMAFEKELPLPKAVARKGYYPAKYSVNFMAPMDAYWITLKNLTWLE